LKRGNSGYIHADTGYKTRTTNRILDLLEEKRPKIICIDELDKMPRQFQKLLNFMESGHIKTRCGNNMILKAREQKYLQLVMKSQGYQDSCNPDFVAYTYLDIPKTNL
jgi:predicted RNase H-like nuclease (RuvC/YqgF family)